MDASKKIIDLPSSLRKEAAAGQVVDKVGMLPVWLEDGVLHVRLAKPHATKPEKGDPGFQLPKGTRQFYDATSDQWRDIGRGHDPQRWDGVMLEPLPAAALREGMEEVGLVPDNIRRIWDIGLIAVKSATTGEEKRVHIYAAEVKEKERFAAADAAHTAGEVGWFRVDDPRIRPDHAAFLQALRPVLEPALAVPAHAKSPATLSV